MSLMPKCRMLAVRALVVHQTRNSRLRNIQQNIVEFYQAHYEFTPANMLHKQRVKAWIEQHERFKFSIDKDDKLPAEFQAAKFLITRGAGVKFSDSKRWYQLDDATKHAFLPEFSDDTHVEAVDVSSMDIVAQGLAALEAMPALRYLNMSNCRHLDDFALDRLMAVQNSLEYLDLSGCIRLSERGIASLHRLKKLRRLRLYGMYHVKEAQLLSLLLLEQLPQLHIDGVDYTDLSQPVQQHTIMPQFLRSMRRFETRMIEKMNFTSRISRWEAFKLRRNAQRNTPDNVQLAEFNEYYAQLDANQMHGDDVSKIQRDDAVSEQIRPMRSQADMQTVKFAAQSTADDDVTKETDCRTVNPEEDVGTSTPAADDNVKRKQAM